MSTSPTDDRPAAQRLDRWLWCVRLFKTRQLAAAAVQGGKVHLNDKRVKPAHAVRLVDAVAVSRPGYSLQLTVRALPSRRGPAPEAGRCYDESAVSRVARETVVAQQRLASAMMPRAAARPTRQGRRELRRLRGRE